MEKRPSLSVGGMFSLIGVEVEHGIRSQPFPRHVATDSRDVERGGAFVALEGERTDGHRYIPQALENGASLMVVRRGKRPADPLVPCVELEDPERDLARLASEYLRRVEPREVVAVTGKRGEDDDTGGPAACFGDAFSGPLGNPEPEHPHWVHRYGAGHAVRRGAAALGVWGQ